MSESTTIPPIVNQTMKLILKSPAHGMISNSILLITFTGRKSGRSYSTPVSYSQEGDLVTIFTHARWWKNLRGGAPVSLRLRGRDLNGLAEPDAEDKHAIAENLSRHLMAVPNDARYYGVTFDGQGRPNAAEVEQGAQSVVMVRVRLC